MATGGVRDKGQFQQGFNRGPQMVPTERCERHSHKRVDRYCQNHAEVGCSTCMAVRHKPCQDTFYIYYIHNNPNPVNPEVVDMKLETAADLLTDQNAKFQQEKERLLKCEALCLEKVKEFREDINQRLYQLEKNSMKVIRARIKPELENLDKLMNQMQTTKAAVLSAKQDIETASNASQIVLSTKKGNTISDNAVTYVAEVKSEVKEQEIHFTPDSKLAAMLNESNFLGQLQELSIRKEESGTSSSTQNTPITIKSKKQYNVRITTDENKCFIRSICVLENGTIILTDNSNRKLKQVDSSTYTVTHYCDVSGHPWQVCAISNQEVVVSCGLFIQFVSLGSKMVPTKKIKTNPPCYGLAYKFGMNHTVQGLFYSSDVHLALSADGSNVYVADQRNGLIAHERNGKVFAKFNGPELKRAESVCITDNGNVLACGHDSTNVLQFTPDCKMVGEVMKCDAGCQSICYTPGKSNIIIIGYFNRDTIDVCDVNL